MVVCRQTTVFHFGKRKSIVKLKRNLKNESIFPSTNADICPRGLPRKQSSLCTRFLRNQSCAPLWERSPIWHQKRRYLPAEASRQKIFCDFNCLFTILRLSCAILILVKKFFLFMELSPTARRLMNEQGKYPDTLEFDDVRKRFHEGNLSAVHFQKNLWRENL